MNKKGFGLIILGITAIAGIAGKIYLGKCDKFSNKWFKNVDDLELNKEREKVRKEYCKAGSDKEKAILLQKLLWRIDEVIRRRQGVDEDENGFPKHSENGWHLPED